MLPPYVYDLIAAVQKYEDEHGDKSMCFDGVLAKVPTDEQHAARVLAAYKLNQPSPMQETIAPASVTVGGETYRLPDDATPQNALMATCRRAVAFNRQHGLANPTEFRVSTKDAVDAGCAGVSITLEGLAGFAEDGVYAPIVVDDDVQPGWLRVYADGRHHDTSLLRVRKAR